MSREEGAKSRTLERKLKSAQMLPIEEDETLLEEAFKEKNPEGGVDIRPQA